MNTAIDLPTTPVAHAIFEAWSESLETHSHLLARDKGATLESLRRTETLIGDALAGITRVRADLEKQNA